MTEKPMATRWSDGLAMVRACDEAGVRLFVVKQNRRNRTLQMVKQAMAKGRFGRVYMVNVNVFWSRPQAYYDSADWRGTWEFDGGAFMNQASHYVDLLDWLVGPVESVMAYTGTLARNIEVEDTGVAALKWRNGATGLDQRHHAHLAEELRRLASPSSARRARVRVGGVAVNQIEHWQFQDSDPMDAQLDEASYQTTSVYGFGHPLYYENVIRSLREASAPEIDGREGLKSLELLIAMYLSARDGRRINLPLGLLRHGYQHPSLGHRRRRRGAGRRLPRLALRARQRRRAHRHAAARFGQNVYVGNDVRIGNNVKIQNNVSVYDAVTLEDDVFCGPSMVFTNVYNPRAAVARKDEYRRTLVKRGATLGANCTVVCGVTVGQHAFIGAGAVVNRDVPDFALMLGVPARQVGWMSRFGERLELPLRGEGEAVCRHTGDRYRLSGHRLQLEA